MLRDGCILQHTYQRSAVVIEISTRIFAGRNEDEASFLDECHSSTLALGEVLDKLIECIVVALSLGRQVEDGGIRQNEGVEVAKMEATFYVQCRRQRIVANRRARCLVGNDVAHELVVLF